jgi:hypothetical protein
MTWTDTLRPIDLDGLRPIFPADARAKNAGVRVRWTGTT